MKQRFITAFVLIAVLLPCIWYGGIAFDIAAYLFIAVACHEILNCFGNSWTLKQKAPVYFLFVLAATAALFHFEYFIPICGLMLVYLFYLVVWHQEVTFDQIGIVYMLFNILCLTIRGFNAMYEVDKLLVIMALIGTYLTDSCALFCGMAFGKHKLNERISPKKTIEGSVGAFIITAIVLLIYGFLTLKQLSPIFLIAASILLPIIGQIGDLAFSAIKRHYQIKDFGNIFPGHGGVLDRIDSLTFNVIVIYCLMIILL